MNKLSTAERVQVVAALVEGNSINSTVRMTGISKPTILKLLASLGTACLKLHDEKVRGVEAKRIQCDEIWAFVHSKQKNVKVENAGKGHGDIWTWSAIDADSKLMIAYNVGDRGVCMCQDFLDDLADRVIGRPQVTTDSYNGYFKGVVNAFNGEVDHSILQKIYGPAWASGSAGSARYSPAVCTGIKIKHVNGDADPKHISTSFVERSNLTMRMGMRRFTRLTNGFSKKAQNHAHMVALFFAFYNFCRVHMTTKKTPAVAAGLADRTWKIDDLIALIAD
jgi:IS1 family transposase